MRQGPEAPRSTSSSASSSPWAGLRPGASPRRRSSSRPADRSTPTTAAANFHTFTEVANFGGGCVDILNQILGLTAVPECANAGVLFATTGIAPGGELEGAPLSSGTHRFECLIHPWMRTTVVVP
jgi:hypothetical protein